tara:strand:- start:1971 stop:2495 length:525 start_codon:yes stop_codon:yes gene_type:complete
VVELREIEAKVLEVNLKKVEADLRALGAKKAFDGTLHAIYFDFPNKSLQKNKIAFRLRSDGKKNILCIKSKPVKGKVKSLDEREVQVKDFKKAQAVIKSLGFVEKLNIKKKRKSFKLGRARIELERIKGIPDFIEIEAPSQQRVVAVAKKLGFSEKSLVPWNTFKLLKYYNKKV